MPPCMGTRPNKDCTNKQAGTATNGCERADGISVILAWLPMQNGASFTFCALSWSSLAEAHSRYLAGTCTHSALCLTCSRSSGVSRGVGGVIDLCGLNDPPSGQNGYSVGANSIPLRSTLTVPNKVLLGSSWLAGLPLFKGLDLAVSLLGMRCQHKRSSSFLCTETW